MSEIDAARFPRLAGYAGKLPRALDSFPKYRAKASLLRGVLEALEEVPSFDDAPAPLATLGRAPPPPSVWIPEVHFVAMHYYVADALGFDDAQAMEWTYRANEALTQSPMYRALCAGANPGVLLRIASMGWGFVHDGVKLGVRNRSRAVELSLSHPPHLYLRDGHESAATGFRAVIETARGRDVQVDLVTSTSTDARFAVSWT